MIIDHTGKIRLLFCAVLSDRQIRSVLDVSLYEHHPIGLTEALGGTLSSVFVHLQLFPAKPSFIQMTLQGRSFEYAWQDTPLQFQDRNDLINGALRHFPP